MKYALCPSCLSTLQITKEQLKVKEGLIRCGNCKDLFNAYRNELTHADQTLTESQENAAALPIELMSEEQRIDAEPSSDEPIWETQTTVRSSKFPFKTCAFLLTLLLLGQVIYLTSNNWTQSPPLQASIHRINSAFGLHIPSYQNINDIRIIDRQFNQHPSNNNLLSLTLSFKNTAPVAQAFPVINVALMSNQGKQIALGQFSPNGYLNKEDSHDKFDAQIVKKIHLTFKKPTATATGFEIYFSE